MGYTVLGGDFKKSTRDKNQMFLVSLWFVLSIGFPNWSAWSRDLILEHLLLCLVYLVYVFRFIYVYVYIYIASIIGQWNEFNYIYIYNAIAGIWCIQFVLSMGFATWRACELDQFCIFSTDAGRKNNSSKHSFRSNMWGILSEVETSKNQPKIRIKCFWYPCGLF